MIPDFESPGEMMPPDNARREIAVQEKRFRWLRT
jgi:hypothetical protein